MVCRVCSLQARAPTESPIQSIVPMSDSYAQEHYDLPDAKNWYICQEEDCNQPWKYDEQWGWQAPNM